MGFSEFMKVGAPLLGPVGSIIGAGITSAMNMASAKQQMKFQKEMSDTAHQREVADFRAAGLNPVLSAGGSGASTPAGASSMAGDFRGIGDVLNSALTVAQIKKVNAEADSARVDSQFKSQEFENYLATNIERIGMVRAQYQQAVQDVLNSKIDASEKQMRIEEISKRIEQMTESIKNLQNITAKSGYDLAKARKEADFWNSAAGTIAPYVREFGPILNGTVNTVVNSAFKALSLKKGKFNKNYGNPLPEWEDEPMIPYRRGYDQGFPD